MALAHVVQNPVEAADARSDLFERRRLLMDDWEAYLPRPGPSTAMNASSAASKGYTWEPHPVPVRQSGSGDSRRCRQTCQSG